MEECKMNQFEKIVEKIARENGTTPEHVRQEMQRAIDRAWEQNGGMPGSVWAGMTFRGERPTPEELIPQLAALMQKNGTLAG